MRKPIIYGIICLGIFMISSSCAERKDPLFTLLSPNKTGIKFRNTIEETESFNHLSYSYLYNGGGVAVGDINNDGLPDLYFPGNLVTSRLYLNKGDLKFEDISEMAGVTAADTWNTGAVMADINGDGYLDIYVCSSTDGRPKYRKNLLFINNGDLTFSEKAAKYGIEDPAYSTHSAFFDYDKDGDLDLFVLNHSVDRYAMFNQQSEFHKHEYSPNYGQKLFRNDVIRFTDVTRDAGIISNVINFGLGIAVADFNNDYWPDIYICNDYYEKDYLYINQKDGTFSEQMEDYFSHISFSSMGCDAGDINHDGYLDLVTLDMLPEANKERKLVEGPHNYEKFKLLEKRGFYNQTTRNMLQLNNNGKYFTEIGQYAGVYNTNWSWAPLLHDFDHDGNKDLFITNGYGKNNTHMDVITMMVKDMQGQRKGETGLKDMEFIHQIPSTIVNNYMYRNNGNLTFTNATDDWGFDKETLSNGAAYADLDNDGDMDLIISNINEYAYIYRNNSEKINDNHYIKIKLKGDGLNTHGVGARIEVFCDGNIYAEEFMPSRGYMSSVDHAMIIGLGIATHIDTLRVIWPNLKVQELTQLKVDQTLTLSIQDAVNHDFRKPADYVPVFEAYDIDSTNLFRHSENDYIDFNKQPLLPYLLSTQGPRLTTGDVNNDGLADVFMGGAKGSPGQLFIQGRDKSFDLKKMPCFQGDSECEDMGVLFVDVDSDGDLDLYVVSGGNEYPISSAELQDRLYLNDGKGSFEKSQGYLPEMLTSGSCVTSSDMDNDGDADLFIGGRLTPGLYPLAPRSYVLENDGSGHFKDVTAIKNKGLLNPGMVTDALWTDFSGDGMPDLIILGEWMNTRMYENADAKLREITEQAWMNDSYGWWNRISPGDFDHDGDIDYVLGNLGLNSEFKASPDKPVRVYAFDFDNNGSMDPVLCQYIMDKSYPIYSRDDLAEQIGSIRDLFPDYASYAEQTIKDLFAKDLLDKAYLLEANNFTSTYLENKGHNQFEPSPLPITAQFSPVYGIQAGDFNDDGHLDLILAGNFFGFRIKYGRYDANKGLMLLGNGKGQFQEVSNQISGLHIDGEVRDIAMIKTSENEEMLIFSINNDQAKIYTFKPE